ncbi:DgyrCDS6705 [Dimorphilus gyrociliatus]|uniref:DgyrCDS6705 n=1 Tax=Dimorphilus gyrociliatus TaxID=2664684 RepID=A0A7I8VRI9_9ANNE|nr:DgyrCDS6705 [Dimorphilus gyrociliatus]
MDNIPTLETTKKIAATKSNISKWSRDELEDRYLRMYEEDIMLKKHARKQEDRIKQLETKLSKLKKQLITSGTTQDLSKTKGRDLELEERLDEYHTKIYDLEKANNILKEKLMVAKQQLNAQPKRPTPYTHGIVKQENRMSKSLRVTGPSSPGKPFEKYPRYGHSLLEESRAEINRLERVIEELNEQLNITDQHLEQERERYRIREMEFEEDLNKIKQQMSEGQRVAIQENIDIIKLKRDVKEKSTNLISLQSKYSNVEEQFRMATAARQKLIDELEAIGVKFKSEQNRNLALEQELKETHASQRRIVELQERTKDLENECAILKDSNEKLVNSAFDMERERDWRSREKALKVQIAQLEATLKADVGEKGSILDKLTEEREKKDKMEEEHKDLRINYFKLKHENDDLQQKMKFFTKESAVDMQEIEEALILVKRRKEKENQELDFLHKVDDERSSDIQRSLEELNAQHADTINELEKTRNMLIVQHKINKDYQQEAVACRSKLDETRQDYESRLEEYAQLLDIRAARIKKLEAQLRDVAYGTRRYTVKKDLDEDEDMIIDDAIELERGHNMFEIHIKRVVLTPEAIEMIEDDEASVFCTYDFYEFETQATPVLRAPKPEFEFTSQYIVKTDDFFLYYLQKECLIVELHHSMGTDYQTVAVAKIKLSDLLEKHDGKLHKSVHLTASMPGEDAISFGIVEFWMRLRVPLEEAFNLYKQRIKSKGYIASNIESAGQALKAMDDEAAEREAADNINVLTVKIKHGSKIFARCEGVQPSSFVVYKFFDFPDHDTSIVTASNDPQFNDNKSYPITMTSDMDSYLRKSNLSCYIFDETDPEETEYLGIAKIPLLPLANDKPIQGIFEIIKKDGSTNGYLDVSLKWRNAYFPPKGVTVSKDESNENLTLLPGEKDELEKRTSAKEKEDAMLKEKLTPIVASNEPVKHRPKPPPVAAKSTSDSVQHSIMTSSIQEESEPDTEPPTPRPDASKRLINEQEEYEEEEEREESEEDEEQYNREQYYDENESIEEKVSKIRSEYEEDKNETTSQVSDVSDMRREAPRDEPQPITPHDSDVDEEKSSGRSTAGEDSDAVVIPKHTEQIVDNVTIAIGELSLCEESPLLEDNSVTDLYVAYQFLGIDPKETETPYSLNKPTEANKPISFNFERSFDVDYEYNQKKRRYLASMLLPEDADKGRIRFMIVSEPQDEEADCEDVGIAFVSCIDILEKQCDVIDEDIPILAYKDEQTIVGYLKVTVKCLQALQAVREEMQTPPATPT